VFRLKQPADGRLLVGFDKADDAGVYLLTPNVAIVQTVDFFTPIVDDPLWYGRIAAANSLSDVYAMGGKPVTAMNIFCFPEELGADVMNRILKGGLEKTIEAGCTLVGGHSVQDKELKFGMSVTGTVNPKRIFSNDRAESGQVLVLTKPLGTGIITTAAKWDDCPPRLLNEAVENMAALNDKACEGMLATSATSATDVTGFGLMGHLSEMTRASGVRARVSAKDLPIYDGVLNLVDKEYVTRGDKLNRAYSGDVKIAKGIDPRLENIIFDPQTSGGLLISMPEKDVAAFKKFMKKHKREAWVIGEILDEDKNGLIEVTK
jgi:selenide, water dikinase